MDRETSPKPPLCRGGCGFYGSATTEGLCSECYKKHVKHKQDVVTNTLKARSNNNISNKNKKEPQQQRAADNSGSKIKIEQKNYINDSDSEEVGANADMPTTSQAISTPTTDSTNLDDEASAGAATTQTTTREKKNRCAECGKKVGLTGFTCRCGGLFCPIHRYSDKHNCTFNYREMGAEEIRRNNPTVTAEKIRKI